MKSIAIAIFLVWCFAVDAYKKQHWLYVEDTSGIVWLIYLTLIVLMIVL